METWSLKFTSYEEKEERLRETLFTLGNGRFATRGSGEENSNDQFHYPGTYINGGYNRLSSLISGVVLENEDLVNWPNWLCMSFRHPDEDWFHLNKVKIINYLHLLNLKNGYVFRSIHFADSSGRESILECLRIVSMDNQHVGAVKWTLKPLNWSGKIEVRGWVDAGTTNEGVQRYLNLEKKHYSVLNKKWWGNKFLSVETKTSFSEIKACQAIRMEINPGSSLPDLQVSKWEELEKAGYTFTVTAKTETKIEIEKVMAFFTSKDFAIITPELDAQRLVQRLPGFQELLRNHILQWERLWNLCDIEIKEKIRETKLLRLHIFHLLQTVSLKSMDLDVGVPARGLHGEAYRGHIFWDEMFIFPFLNLRIPELTRSLLMYRYRRLNEAQENSKAHGCGGALFPWQSASNGQEQSQVMHLNPVSGHWIPDVTYLQYHINSSIVYNIWQYYQATMDYEFVSHYGLKMVLEISKFWVSKLKFNSTKNRFEILNVVGPDEFHTHYPNDPNPGINNNAYTNFMASWSIKASVELFLHMSSHRQAEILDEAKITRAELNKWYEITRLIYLPIMEDGIIEQFEGFHELAELDFNKYIRKYGDIQRIDRILEAEGDSANHYKVNKQCDVLMIYYLFSLKEIEAHFEWLGYHTDLNKIRKNIDYHLGLSTNGSSLSRVVHAWVISKYNTSKAWEWFNRSLEIDIADIQGGTSAEGIHLGAMAGTVDIVQRCFTGLEISSDILCLNPTIPKELLGLNFHIHFRGNILKLVFTTEEVSVSLVKSAGPGIQINILGKLYEIRPGQEIVTDIQGDLRSFENKIIPPTTNATLSH